MLLAGSGLTLGHLAVGADISSFSRVFSSRPTMGDAQLQETVQAGGHRGHRPRAEAWGGGAWPGSVHSGRGRAGAQARDPPGLGGLCTSSRVGQWWG